MIGDVRVCMECFGRYIGNTGLIEEEKMRRKENNLHLYGCF